MLAQSSFENLEKGFALGLVVILISLLLSKDGTGHLVNLELHMPCKERTQQRIE